MYAICFVLTLNAPFQALIYLRSKFARAVALRAVKMNENENKISVNGHYSW